jgi:hypothetical protein
VAGEDVGWDDAGRLDVLLSLCAVNWLECTSGNADDGWEDISNSEMRSFVGAASDDGTRDRFGLEGGGCGALLESSSRLLR